MDISKVSASSTNPPKCVIAGESEVAQDIIDALGEEGFVSIKRDWTKWENRTDLFDHVIRKTSSSSLGSSSKLMEQRNPLLLHCLSRHLMKLTK